MREYLRSKTGVQIGWIDRGDTQDVAHGQTGRIVGYFNRRLNKTTDFRGVTVAFGDQLARLIYQGTAT